MNVAAAVLAAGTASRMGEHKLLLEVGGEPLIRRSVRSLLGAGFGRVTVVVGREPERIEAALAGLPCAFALNPDYATQGMERSLRAAVLGTPLGSDGLLFTLADMAFVSSATHRSLLETFERERPLVAASRYGEVIAPPHLFSHELFGVLGTPGNGAKPLILQHLERVAFVEQPPEGLFDVDTPEDLERARMLLAATPER